MKLIRSIAMPTDHNYYGYPIEVGAVELWCDESLTAREIEIAKQNQEMKLRSMAKRMPFSYWKETPND